MGRFWPLVLDVPNCHCNLCPCNLQMPRFFHIWPRVKSRTPSAYPNPHENGPKWAVHLPQNGTIGFDPQPYAPLNPRRATSRAASRVRRLLGANPGHRLPPALGGGRALGCARGERGVAAKKNIRGVAAWRTLEMAVAQKTGTKVEPW